MVGALQRISSLRLGTSLQSLGVSSRACRLAAGAQGVNVNRPPTTDRIVSTRWQDRNPVAAAYMVPSHMQPIAHTQPASSRAVAQFATTGFFLRDARARRL